jgi:hypothetical protein
MEMEVEIQSKLRVKDIKRHNCFMLLHFIFPLKPSLYEVWSKRYRPDIRPATTLTFTHDMSIPITYWRLLTELHAVLHRLSNIKQHTWISRGVWHLDQMEKVEIIAVIKYLCKKGISPRKSMKTSWIHLGRGPLSIALWKMGCWN